VLSRGCGNTSRFAGLDGRCRQKGTEKRTTKRTTGKLQQEGVRLAGARSKKKDEQGGVKPHHKKKNFRDDLETRDQTQPRRGEKKRENKRVAGAGALKRERANKSSSECLIGRENSKVCF